MTVAELMRTDVVTADPDTTISELAFTMANEGVGSVVITDIDEPVGIVTDRDIALDVLGTGADPEEYRATDVMSTDPVTADIDAGVFELIRLMGEESVRRVPIVKNGSLAGIVTFDDLFVLIAGEVGILSDVIQAESPPY